MSGLRTARLTLRPWRDSDRATFAAMHAEPEVMADYGGLLTRAESDAKFERYIAAYQRHGYSRWVIETPDSGFLGYAGIMQAGPDHPLGTHNEIGWRLTRAAWGLGFASEAASAALADGFERLGLAEVVSYTAPDNLRSQAVMGRIGLTRDPTRDFTLSYPRLADWRGLVWFARRS